MNTSRILDVTVMVLFSLALAACNRRDSQQELEHHTIVTTSPAARDVVLTQQYVCQIHSRRHIEICALQEGYLDEITLKEGQAVRAKEVLFKVIPAIYKANLDAEKAEAQFAKLEFENTKKLFESPIPVVSIQEVALYRAKLEKAEAKANLAEAELKFTEVRAPFDGIIDRLHHQQGSLVKKEDVLTTLSDNSVMWVYFNVPEARYLEYMADHAQNDRVANNADADDAAEVEDDADDQDDVAETPNSSESSQIELVLANGVKFSEKGTIGAIEAQFNNETGNIAFRADFPNPDRLLRHGQTGTVLIHRTAHNAVVIPQRATFEILDKRYVYVVGQDGVVHQREIVIQNELDDIFVIHSGLGVKDRFVLEGIRQVHDGETVESEYLEPEKALAELKHHAE